MKPHKLKTKIFLDSGDPKETKEIVKLLGFLDGQTTNPTLIAKNAKEQLYLEKKFTPLEISPARSRAPEGPKGGLFLTGFTEKEIWDFYKKTAKEISKIIPESSVSLEVYADKKTSQDQMLYQAKQLFSWIPNAHIKFPITCEGLKAAEKSIQKGFRINMTLCFSQEQAAAVYSATRGAAKGQVFVSPFVGRLDDRGENGMDLIKNIIKMYQEGDGHVEVLTASARNLNHFLYAIKLGSEAITAPFKILKEWHDAGMPLPDNNFTYFKADLKHVPYQQINLAQDWQKFNIAHKLTEAGIDRFSGDWNAILRKT